MSVLSAVVLLIAFFVILVISNQLHARISLVEVTLNEGAAPGHQHIASNRPASAEVASLLGPGLHLFLSRGCAACQRVATKLSDTERASGPLIIRYVDRPHPALREALAATVDTITAGDQDLATAIGADPLPYTIAVGEHGLIARGVTPDLGEVWTLARQAGLGEVAR